jgi:hypothetical protein
MIDTITHEASVLQIKGVGLLLELEGNALKSAA